MCQQLFSVSFFANRAFSLVSMSLVYKIGTILVFSKKFLIKYFGYNNFCRSPARSYVIQTAFCFYACRCFSFSNYFTITLSDSSCRAGGFQPHPPKPSHKEIRVVFGQSSIGPWLPKTSSRDEKCPEGAPLLNLHFQGHLAFFYTLAAARGLCSVALPINHSQLPLTGG
jgi:hypothetical protein